MTLKHDLENWDGKSSIDIEEIHRKYSQNSFFIQELLLLIKIIPLQKGASWILKKYLEAGGKLKKKEQSKIIGLLNDFEHWESKLHLLQCFPYLLISKNEVKMVETFLRNCLSDSNKFLRAWSYNGFYELSSQYPEYQQETKQFF
ncbi:MAG: hypothetical protein OQL19_20625 [Gammaproteobacteria bacterium]|nr:hypothetical protein [Gammaproteobacteria bacterium]